MGKRKNRVPENVSDFAGPDADQENIEKLAAAAKAANEKGGHNSEPTTDALRSAANEIEVALVEIDGATRILQSARQKLATARKASKGLLGSKAWVDSVEAAVKLKRQSDKGSTGEIVTEHRQMGAVLKAIDSPLYKDFKLFAFDEPVGDPPKDDRTVANEAFLAGEHAGLNGEPKDACPHQPGTPEAFGWRNGWQVGADKLTDSFRTGARPIPSEASAH